MDGTGVCHCLTSDMIFVSVHAVFFCIFLEFVVVVFVFFSVAPLFVSSIFNFLFSPGIFRFVVVRIVRAYLPAIKWH